MKNSTYYQLQTSTFFRELPHDVLQILLNMGNLYQYSRKEIIFHAGIYEEQVYLLMDGEVMIYNLTRHGNKKILFILGKGHLLNHNIISQKPVSIFCEVIHSACILQIPLKPFIELMREHMALTQAVMMEYEHYIWRLSHQLKNTSGNLLIERKIAAKLWKLGRDFGQPSPDGIYIHVKITMTLLADFVGAPRENISRACKSLTKRGLLIYRDQHFILPNPTELAKFYKQI